MTARHIKITGGRRIYLRVDQLQPIWERLVAAGSESGHAYGKALRTVKSCVGSAWFRHGVQDLVAMAIRLEPRCAGLNAAIERHVASYSDEWRDVLRAPTCCAGSCPL